MTESAIDPGEAGPPANRPAPDPDPRGAAADPPNGGGPVQPALVPVKSSDLLLVMAIGGFATLLLVAFGYLLHQQGLLRFPDVGNGTSRGDVMRYYQDALDYRERRLALALVLRTFITGFGFVVGLALCTQGGIFILRQVTAFTDISLRAPNAATDMGQADPDPNAVKPRSWLFSFASYSPGVVFLLGGVSVMGATQYFAIPITWLEIVPGHAVQLCFDPETEQWREVCPANTSLSGQTEEPVGVSPDACDGENPPKYCK
jgi:hypothetical protein